MEPDPAALNEPDPPQAVAGSHPRIAEAEGTAAAADASRRLAEIQTRDSPEIGILARSSREIGSTQYDNRIGIQFRLPFSTDARNTPRQMAAQAELTEATATAANVRRQVELQAARARVDLDTARQAAVTARQRAVVYRQQRGLSEAAFRGGQVSLGDVIRVRALATEADVAQGRAEIALRLSPLPREPVPGDPAMKIVATLALLGALTVFSAQAHPGHGDDTPAPVSGTAAPRTEAQSDLFELVATVRSGAAIIYLDRFATNEPVESASIEVGEGDTTARAAPQPDGTYRLEAPWLARPGRHELVFTVTAGEDADLLNASLDLPADDHAAGAAVSGPRARLQAALGDRRGPVIAAFGFLLGVFTTLVFQARSRWRAAMGGMALLSGLLVAGAAFAHPGHDGDEPAPPAATNAPRRQPDGSVSMPKDAQRLLAIRTVLARENDAPRTVQVIGQVVADPGAAGRVQASQPGRVAPGDQGLARLGQRVQQGDILAVVTPSIGAVERGGVQAQVAELDATVRLAQAKVTRLSGLSGSVPGKDIDDARLELDGARKRRSALSPSLTQGEILRAPVSGVVSVASAQFGALVESKDILFEIVDPARLWVEATLTDPSLAGQVKAATAVTADGTQLAVTFIGRGMTLRQGAVPLQFRIDGAPPGLSVGSPVTVVAELDGKDRGVALPRAAVIRQANGLSAIWDHVSAERFVARPVRIRALDAGRVLVLGGLPSDPAPRVVVQGAELLGQVR